MAVYPTFKETFENGSFSGFSETDTENKLDVLHYTRASQLSRGDEPVFPFCGAFVMAVEAEKNTPGTDAFLSGTDTAFDQGATATAHYAFWMFISEDMRADNDASVNVVEWISGSGDEFLLKLVQHMDGNEVGWRLKLSSGDGTTSTTDYDIEAGVWTHICVKIVNAASDATAQMFVNGELAGSEVTEASSAAFTSMDIGWKSAGTSFKRGFLLFDKIEVFDENVRPRPEDEDPLEMDRYHLYGPLFGASDAYQEHVFVGGGRVTSLMMSNEGSDVAYVDLYDSDRNQPRVERHKARIFCPNNDTSYLDSSARFIDFDDGCLAVITAGSSASNDKISVWIDVDERLDEQADDDEALYRVEAALWGQDEDNDPFDPDYD